VIQGEQQPFMGVKERAMILRKEAETHIIEHISDLSKITIDGNHKKNIASTFQRLQSVVHEQDRMIHKYHYSLWNYNTIESIFLGCCVIVNLSGIMFDSPYIRGGVKSAIALTIMVVTLIFASIVYFIVLFIHEIVTTSKQQRLRGLIIWHRVKGKHFSQIGRLIREQNKDYGRKEITQHTSRLPQKSEDAAPSIYDSFLIKTRLLRFKDKLLRQYGVDCVEDFFYLEIDELTALGVTKSQAEYAKTEASPSENIKPLLEQFGMLAFYDQLCALGVREKQDLAKVDIGILTRMGIPKLKAKNLKKKSLLSEGSAKQPSQTSRHHKHNRNSSSKLRRRSSQVSI
jgi:hypothetical protein